MNHCSCSGCSSGGLQWEASAGPTPSRFGGRILYWRIFCCGKGRTISTSTLCNMYNGKGCPHLTRIRMSAIFQWSFEDVSKYICININKHRDSLPFHHFLQIQKQTSCFNHPFFSVLEMAITKKKTTIKKLAFFGSQDLELWGASAVDIPLLSATTWATFWAALSASYCVMPPSCVICFDKGKIGVDPFSWPLKLA